MQAQIPVFPRVETRFGPMFTLQGDTVIGRSLRVYGEFAGDEVDTILSLARPGTMCWTLGRTSGFTRWDWRAWSDRKAR